MKFTLQPVRPFRLDLTAWTLRRDPRNPVDRWEEGRYRRVLVLEEAPLEVVVMQTAPAEHPQIVVEAIGARSSPRLKAQIAAALDKMLGLSLDLSGFYEFAASQRRLGPLASRFRGLKPPRFPTAWEAVVNAVSCQQLSMTVGLTVMGRLAMQFGPRVVDGSFAFPRPVDLAAARPSDLRQIGYSLRKADVILELAKALADGALDLEAIDSLDDDSAVAFLTGLRGIGRWSAQYVLLRGLGRLNVFPADDVGFQNKLAKWLHLPERPDYEGVHTALRQWRPYGGLMYFFMLLEHLAGQGLVAEEFHPAAFEASG